MGVMVGPKRTVASGLTIPLAATVAVVVPATLGARGLILKFYGSAVANALAVITAVPSWDGTADVVAGQSLTVNPAAASILSNGTAATGVQVFVRVAALDNVIGTPFVRLGLQALVGDITTVTIEAQSILDSPGVGV